MVLMNQTGFSETLSQEDVYLLLASGQAEQTEVFNDFGPGGLRRTQILINGNPHEIKHRDTLPFAVDPNGNIRFL